MTPSIFRRDWQWTAEMGPHLRSPFLGAEKLSRNHSQAWQDIFVLMALGGLREGRYLEVGGHVPIDNNNTCLLHREFGWTGVTLELDASHFPHWKRCRPDSKLVIADALSIDYAQALPQWFGEDRQLDYLQLDIDPSINTLGVLKLLPLAQWRFSVITFETDVYAGDTRARDESRAILSAHGYQAVAKDVGVLFPPVSPLPIPFEDWWVDPQTVRPEIIEQLQAINAQSTWPQDLLFAQ
ncbi:hypothetical protein CCR94_05855 [Rhodoblastus sphagnicola]|uniref:Methyltransferase FkbM domain-containing protein n=1 Tax=Rhodoblastus sphagnicola TaxID=333368 RepID=A0A2S6NCI9_9HYPH|nr:hypothetical protein [Rhodoblastus sphagnicola]MBB4199355.1 hypothetical protein [Rhodoblastus sphagnicola]PPQ32333.1 hypothetical protein CCR94_05855 [Rhodoblastus sphagnicola]